LKKKSKHQKIKLSKVSFFHIIKEFVLIVM
jgi:hypothetical protein